MATRAFVLVETEAGRTDEAFEGIGCDDAVRFVDLLTGPYDLLVVVEGSSYQEVMHSIDSLVCTTPGVTHTITCFSLRTRACDAA